MVVVIKFNKNWTITENTEIVSWVNSQWQRHIAQKLSCTQSNFVCSLKRWMGNREKNEPSCERKANKIGEYIWHSPDHFYGLFFFHQGPKMNPIDLSKYTGVAPLSLCTAAPILQNKKIVKESRRWLYKGYLQCTFKEIKPLNNFLNITYNDYIYYSTSPSRNK